MRNLHEVLAQVIDLLPFTEIDLRNDLINYQNSVAYCAPEQMSIYWKLAGLRLYKSFGDNPQGWQLDIVKVWNPSVV